MNSATELNLVLIDDNFVLRAILHGELEYLEAFHNLNFKVYTSDNGVEGLGLIYVLNPDLIIIDTTLPKYSGREIVNYLSANENFRLAEKKVILIHQGQLSAELLATLPANFKKVSKADNDFLPKVIAEIKSHLGIRGDETESFWSKLRRRFARKALRWSNTRDLLLFKRFTLGNAYSRMLFLLPWLVTEVIVSIWYTLYRFIGSNPTSEVIGQKEKDMISYRVRYYPTLLSLLGLLIVTFLQVMAFIGGGLVIFGVRVDPAFAFRSGDSSYQFSTETVADYDYDDKLITATADGFSLKALNDLKAEPPPEDKAKKDDDQPESYPTASPSEAETVQETEEVLAIEPVYSTAKPSLTTKNAVDYSELTKISLVGKTSAVTGFSLQLSPDGTDWYYYAGDEAAWRKTDQAAVASSDIEQVNENLSKYQELVGAGALYLRVYFHTSEASQTPLLTKITVERKTELLVQVEPEQAPEPVLPEVEVKSVLDFEKLEPLIFNASYVNGQKVILGKILLKDRSVKAKYSVSVEDLAQYEVKVYFSEKNTATKGEYIGTTELYLNPRSEIEFLLRKAATPGGYITAQVEKKDAPSEQFSSLASPIENSTFTVDSSEDGADLTPGNGLCQTAAATCTLRAAIQEANALGGADNIYFSIPVADVGYRDYDNPNVASSGDSLGGDDYWTIRPGSALPAITGTTSVDANTQAINQGDFNTSGPEIELNGSAAGIAGGLSFVSTAINSNLNKIVINGFASPSSAGFGVHASSAQNLLITGSYFGVDVKSATPKPNGYAGVRISGTAVVNVGTSVADGNVISGNTRNIIMDTCAVGMQANIKGNIIGLDVNMNLIPGSNSSDGINSQTTSCTALIGGDTTAERNVVGDNKSHGIIFANPGAGTKVEIYNNFFGTDSTGTLDRGNGNGLNPDIRVQGGTLSAPNGFTIGKAGGGNFFRFSRRGVWFNNYNGPADINANSFGDHTTRSILIDADITWPQLIVVRNNFIGATNSDPYFGRVLGGSRWGIQNRSGSNAIITGNLITGNFIGVLNWSAYAGSRTGIDFSSVATVGGQAAAAGSLCGGVEKNCISNNSWYGIYSLDSVSKNEATLYQDNDFSGGNGADGNANIEQVWLGIFELHSALNRRTDLVGITLDFPAGTKVRTSEDPSTIVTSGVSANVTCFNLGIGCPAAGHTSGVLDNTSVVGPLGVSFSNVNTWYRVTEYSVDATGTKTTYGNFKFEQSHFASRDFTFDADSTNNPQNFAAARVIDGQNYLDRGEPWTNLSGATRNINAANFGKFQIMEVEYVDANPIWNGNEFVITVETTEDIAINAGSHLYFDDGSGVATGGITRLSSAPLQLANGRTSLREAITVANLHTTPDKIIFNIPTSDSGWNTPQFPNAFNLSLPASSLPNITGTGTSIDGNSQTVFSGDSSVAVAEPETGAVSGLATTGPEIILNGNNTVGGALITSSAANLTIDRIGFYNVPNSRALNLVGGANLTVQNSTFVNNGRGGISVNPSSSRVVVEDSVFRENGKSNFVYDVIEGYFDEVRVEDNQFVDNGGFAVGLQSWPASEKQNILRGNLVKSNGFNPVNTAGGFFVTNLGGVTGRVLFEDNYISENAGAGLVVYANAVKVTAKNNVFRGNAVQEIDLSAGIFAGSPLGDGLTANDPGDADVGGNDLQNYPEISNVKYTGSGQYEISGDLDADPAQGPFTIEICESAQHPSGFGGCLSTLGFTISNSPWNVTVTIPGSDGTDSRVFSALATSKSGSTSEFSANFVAEEANPDYEILSQDIDLIYPIGNVAISDTTPVLDWSVSQNLTEQGYPRNVSQFLSGGDYSYEIKKYGNNIYIPHYGLITVVDVSSPASPEVIGSISSNSKSLAFKDDYLFAVATWGRILYAIDISDPASPVQLDTLQNFGGLTDPLSVAVKGNYAYVLNNASISIIDISNPANISEANEIAISSNATIASNTMQIAGNYLFALTDSELLIYDLSNALNPTLLSTGSVLAKSRMFIQGERLFLSSQDTSQLQIVDVTDKSSPSIMTTHTYFGSPVIGLAQVDIQGDHLFLSKGNLGVFILDISNINAIEEVYHIDSLIYTSGIKVSGQYIFNSTIYPLVGTSVFGVTDLGANFPDNLNYDLPLDIVNYEIYLNGASYQTLSASLGTSYQVTQALPLGNYNWQVFGKRADNSIAAASEIEPFRIISVPVTPPTSTPPPATDDGAEQSGGGEVGNTDDSGGIPDIPDKPGADGPNVVPSAGGVDDEESVFKITLPRDLLPAVPFALALLVILLASLLLGPLLDLFSRTGPIIGIFLPRKRKYWGIVFDVIDGKEIPFAAVVLKDANTTALISREITDLQGRYALDAQPGAYLLEVMASGYSTFVQNVDVKTNGEVILDVPMVKASAAKYGVFKQFIYYNRLKLIALARVLYLMLMMIGFVYTIYALVTSPNIINIVFFVLYCVVIAFGLFPLLRGKVKGRVVAEDGGMGLHAAVVRVYNAGQIEDIALTREYGDVRLRASAGAKEVYIQKINYEDKRERLIVYAGSFDRNIQMRLQSKLNLPISAKIS